LRRREEEEQEVQDPNAMDVDREKRWEGDWRYYNCGIFRHIVQYCRNPREVRRGT